MENESDANIQNNAENIDNLEEAIESSIMSKVKNFFDLHKKLKYEQLNDFLDSISLSDVFWFLMKRKLLFGQF